MAKEIIFYLSFKCELLLSVSIAIKKDCMCLIAEWITHMSQFFIVNQKYTAQTVSDSQKMTFMSWFFKWIVQTDDLLVYLDNIWQYCSVPLVEDP